MPFHVVARGRAGASLWAMVFCAKFGEHQPLNRQSETYGREGIELDVSTLADRVGRLHSDPGAANRSGPTYPPPSASTATTPPYRS